MQNQKRKINIHTMLFLHKTQILRLKQIVTIWYAALIGLILTK